MEKIKRMSALLVIEVCAQFLFSASQSHILKPHEENNSFILRHCFEGARSVPQYLKSELFCFLILIACLVQSDIQSLSRTRLTCADISYPRLVLPYVD